MLGKLIKYEFKGTARLYLPFFALLILLTVVNRLSLQFGLGNSEFLEIPAVISMMLYIVAVVAVFVIAMVATIQRFYKNFMTDEGYLMFTLPVSQDGLILSKLIVATIWNIFSVLIAMVSLFFLLIDGDIWSAMIEVLWRLPSLAAANGINLFSICAVILLAMLTSLVAGILQIYASIVIGCMSSRHKLILGLGVYLGFNVVMQTASLVMLPFVTNWFTAITEQGGSPTPVQVVDFFQGTMLYGIGFSLVFGAVFYVITRLMLKKKLNLE